MEWITNNMYDLYETIINSSSIITNKFNFWDTNDSNNHKSLSKENNQSRCNTHNDSDSDSEFLLNVAYNDIDFFTLKGYQTIAKVVKVYDGDTMTVVFFFEGKPQKFRVRLLKIDTAEIKSSNPNECKWAYKAKNRLIELIDDDLVYLVCGKWDKYGRLLVDVYKDSDCFITFNDLLIEENLAYEYLGKTKQTFSQWAPKEAFTEI